MNNKSIYKLSCLIEKYLNRSTHDVFRKWGEPGKGSSKDLWVYKRWGCSIFHDEIAFILEDNIVVDIALTEYTFWFARKNIFYFEGQLPEYKIIKI